MEDSSPIVVFDSGFGGISVLKKLVARMPDENYLYFGDSANAPYGPRPAEEVRKLTVSAIDSLCGESCCGEKRNVKAVVIACNTATAAAGECLQARLEGISVVGIRPALKQAEAAGCRRILSLATAGTLSSASYARQLETLRPQTEVISIPAPGIVTWVEGGMAGRESFLSWLQDLLLPVKEQPIDAVVLGCTHFPFAKEEIRTALDREVRFFDASEDVAKQVEQTLLSSGQRSHDPADGSITFRNSLRSREALAHAWELFAKPC